ncbi:glycosyltransferase 87 family protein [Propionibacteriaceae bacterium Y1700]|uniref:glycosyltransferase 87 family protein n=1 Tax=Microlunatus sp. Y1700 TaxID=3418487 RepID=UPI003DA7A6E1
MSTSTPQGRAVPTSARVLDFLAEFLPTLLVALAILPLVIRGGSYAPWAPQTTDLEVYVYAAADLLAGKDVYQTQSPLGLWFIYPPIAAILMIPLVVGPYVVWQVIWTALLVLAQNSVLKRCGVPRGWKLVLVSMALIIAMEPIRTTLGYGQVNTLLMFLVIADLLPDRPGEKRLIPRGALIGLAASIKLTPLLFLVFLGLLGRFRAVVVGTLTFIALTVIGAVFMWQGTVEFFTGLLGGDTKTSGPQYVGNQSLVGVSARLLGETTTATLVGLGVAAVVALASVLVAVHWWRRGEKVFAVGLCGVATCLASPLSWTHHWVWIVPLGIACLTSNELPRWVRGAGAFLALWVAACLPLSLLPYGSGAADSYDALQQIVANLGPLLGVVIALGLAVTWLTDRRRPTVSHDTISPTGTDGRSAEEPV